MSTTADTSLLPWIGKDYSAGFRGRHILVLGESFYCDDCDPCILAPDSECRQMPRKTVDDYLSYRKGEGEYRSWMKTFIVFERAVYGHETTVEECLAFWNAVIFDNYVQTPVPASRTAPTAAQWEQAVPVFSRLLSEYRPDRIIPWGDRLYNKLPPLDGRERRAGELRRFHPGSVGLSARRRPLLRGALPRPPLLRLLLGILARLPRTIHKTLTIKAHTV